MNAPQSVSRVIHILEALCASAKPVTLADLSRTLHTPKSSVAALLRGLSDAQIVTAADGAFSLGPAAFGLGSALVEARRRVQTSELVRQSMRRLADQSGETVLFAVRDGTGDTMTYVEVIESRSALRFAVAVGDRRPLFCTAGGRVLLAAQTEEEQRAYLKRLKPQPMSSSTQVDKRRLAEAIAEARKSGVAQTVDQATEGVTGTAAPIWDSSGAAVGALIVAAPTPRLGNRRIELADLVRTEAEAISRTLGYRAPNGSSG